MDSRSSSLPDHQATYLGDVVKAHGGRWEVGQEADTGVWYAVERPTPTALHIVIDHTLAGLAAKLDAERSAS
jgi:hypothetical protein